MHFPWVKESSGTGTLTRAEGRQEEEFPLLKVTTWCLQPCMAAHVEKLVLS